VRISWEQWYILKFVERGKDASWGCSQGIVVEKRARSCAQEKRAFSAYSASGLTCPKYNPHRTAECTRTDHMFQFEMY